MVAIVIIIGSMLLLLLLIEKSGIEDRLSCLQIHSATAHEGKKSPNGGYPPETLCNLVKAQSYLSGVILLTQI